MFENYTITSFPKIIKSLQSERLKALMKFQKNQADFCNYRCINIHNTTKLNDFQKCFEVCINLSLRRSEVINNSLTQMNLMMNEPEQYKRNMEDFNNVDKKLNDKSKKDILESARPTFPDYMFTTNENIGIQDARKADDLKNIETNKNSQGGRSKK